MARILIVDDDPAIHEMLYLLLTELGHEVDKAMDPQEFLQAARRSRPDLVMMDMQMPGGGAPMIKSMLESNAELARLPMIFCSGMREEQMKQWFPEAPGRRYLMKPARAEAITSAVAELLAAGGKPPAAKPK